MMDRGTLRTIQKATVRTVRRHPGLTAAVVIAAGAALALLAPRPAHPPLPALLPADVQLLVQADRPGRVLAAIARGPLGDWLRGDSPEQVLAALGLSAPAAVVVSEGLAAAAEAAAHPLTRAVLGELAAVALSNPASAAVAPSWVAVSRPRRLIGLLEPVLARTLGHATDSGNGPTVRIHHSPEGPPVYYALWRGWLIAAGRAADVRACVRRASGQQPSLAAAADFQDLRGRLRHPYRRLLVLAAAPRTGGDRSGGPPPAVSRPAVAYALWETGPGLLRDEWHWRLPGPLPAVPAPPACRPASLPGPWEPIPATGLFYARTHRLDHLAHLAGGLLAGLAPAAGIAPIPDLTKVFGACATFWLTDLRTGWRGPAPEFVAALQAPPERIEPLLRRLLAAWGLGLSPLPAAGTTAYRIDLPALAPVSPCVAFTPDGCLLASSPALLAAWQRPGAAAGPAGEDRHPLAAGLGATSETIVMVHPGELARRVGPALAWASLALRRLRPAEARRLGILRTHLVEPLTAMALGWQTVALELTLVDPERAVGRGWYRQIAPAAQ